jgi:hypothetical protein
MPVACRFYFKRKMPMYFSSQCHNGKMLELEEIFGEVMKIPWREIRQQP